MCNKCNVELGEAEPIVEWDERTEAGRPFVGTHFWMSNSKEDGWTIDVTTWIFDEPVITESLTISYCPFCGRKLN